MTYAVSAKVSTSDSRNLLEFLAENKFCIFSLDNFSGDLTLVDLDTTQNNALDPKWFRYQCIYNGTEPPSKTVFERLMQDELILSFQFSFHR